MKKNYTFFTVLFIIFSFSAVAQKTMTADEYRAYQCQQLNDEEKRLKEQLDEIARKKSDLADAQLEVEIKMMNESISQLDYELAKKKADLELEYAKKKAELQTKISVKVTQRKSSCR